MKVVCGTDFSASAAKAANAAAALVSKGHGALSLVHVLDLSRYEAPSKGLLAHLSETRQARLWRETRRLRKASLAVEEHLLQGRPAEKLASFAAKAKSDLIVVSCRGHTAPIWWPVGSVAERVALHATVPTMVVRNEQAFQAWATGIQTLRVFVGYGFCAASEAALRWVRRLTEAGLCEITVASLAWPPQESWHLGIGDQWVAQSFSPAIPASLEQCLKEKCDTFLGGSKVHIRVEPACGRPDSQLIGLARSAKADLVVVSGSLCRGAEQPWLGAVSRGILYYAPFNVACVPLPRSRSERDLANENRYRRDQATGVADNRAKTPA
jgi:nucleotide-binding universal stress UspA family protein